VKPISFEEPASLRSALDLLDDRSRPIAGGSDLLGELKEGIVDYSTLISLAALSDMRRIEPYEGGLRIGALATISDLEFSPQLTGPYQMLAEAARGVATPEIRYQGTVGGNLCQRPRCLHYRSALTPCFKKGGDSCPAVESPYQDYLSIFGGSRCYAVHPSDLAPPLIALDARLVIAGPSGTREVGAESFFTGPDPDPRRETVLEPRELVTSVILPPMPSGWRGVYSKARPRTAGDFAIVSASVGFELKGGRMAGVRIVLGSAAPTPIRRPLAEALLEGQEPSEDLAQQAAVAALAEAQPLSDNGFKIDLARALISRGVMRVASATGA
jgi:xanthine dehydrogenase YagS FAD-binding subunit